ncbi:dihydropteroate synthase [Peptostreptococcus equinus]|uniref:Dihydropteroate synthase n=1 Tax=Peptostreptococcus equinus TaxID=3003601 RepID=A0ABY7JMN2_9FIRM|nr:dihydropteroate synthase [Peptostreptococcus sp. CBA3647]WAW14345.1 dihydropteroate synthase [Peptostreptococcus sp. CBA3647]
MIIGNKNFDTKNNVYIMGILNVTPDSFSDGGKYNSLDSALFQAESMINNGASIIDIGGESTRPGYTKISDDEEVERVLPVIEKIRANFDTTISLDTYKSGVIKQVGSKIDLVNDIWGLKYDGTMADQIAKFDLACCLMHNRKEADYSDFWSDYMNDMRECIQMAKDAGIDKNKIMLDGGVGFQKTYEQNLMVINRTEELCSFGYPVLIATSKKSVIGAVTDRTVDQRTAGTIATSVIGILKGGSFLRVHDVAENLDAIKICKSVLEEKKWIQSK